MIMHDVCMKCIAGPHTLHIHGSRMGARAMHLQIKSTMAAYGSGSVYVNMTSGDTKEDAHLAARVGGEANLARLRAVKRRVDPCNMFKSHPLQGL